MRTFDGFMVVLTEGLTALRTLPPGTVAYNEKESESKWRKYKSTFINKSKL